MLVIETNLLHKNGELSDHQARIIEVESWDDYVSDIKNGFSKNYNGTLMGTTIPRYSRVENIQYDNQHLSCDIYTWDNDYCKKLAYKIHEQYEMRIR